MTPDPRTQAAARTSAANRGTVIPVPGPLQDALIEAGHALPGWDTEGAYLASPTIRRYQARLASAPLLDETISSVLFSLRQAPSGYAVVRLGTVADALGAWEQFLRVATAILANVALPFQPFRRWPLWKEIGTNLDANPGLSTGTGYNPFHIDLVNATRPPDYTTLLCVRPDPLGSGASILSDARAAASRLTSTSHALLAEKAYRYGSFFDISEVGEECSPFAVLDSEPPDVGFVRFTGKMLAGPWLGQTHAAAATELAGHLIAGQTSLALQRGDLLIVNQHRCAHGREPLGSGQQDIPPAARRLMLQLFLRSRPGPSAGEHLPA